MPPSVHTRQHASGRVSYFVRFRLGKVQTTLTFKTAELAERFVKDCANRGTQWAWNQHHNELDVRDSPTLNDWAEEWFGLLPHVTPQSLENYRRDWRTRWKPHLGHLHLTEIQPADIIRALGQQRGIADKTLANAWGVLASMLKAAVLHGRIEQSPAVGVKLPRRQVHTDEHRYLTGVEFAQVCDDITPHYLPLVMMLGGTGMRWGEATALLVSDIDLTANTVRVTKAWKRDLDRGSYVGPPKTRRARRTITLPAETVAAIRPLVDRRPASYLFTNLAGLPVKGSTFRRDHWLRATANIAEPRPRIHDLRHSHVAWLIAAGVPLPVIQARLGHEKITTTIDTYGHLLPEMQTAAANAASAVFSSGRPLELR